MKPLQKSKLIIRLRYTQPEAVVSVNARTMPVSVVYGEGVRPVLDIKLPADTFHEILLGNTTLTKALGQKKIEVKGPVIKAMALAELFRQGMKIYPDLVGEVG